MSPQHDYVIDNSTGSNVRSDINSVLLAIASNNSGSSAPSTTVASQFFADTNAGIMKLRNTSNNGFVNLFTLAGGVDVDGDSNFRADVTFSGATTGRDVVFDTSDNALRFADNAKAKFGTGDDLQIYHDGSNSFIVNQTGNLVIRSDNRIDFQDSGGNESFASFIDNGAVELYHDGSKKFETISTGGVITGKLAFNNTGTNLHFGDDQKAAFGTGQDLQIFHESNTSKIVSTASQFSFFTNGNLQIFNENGFANLADFIEGGACNLYFDAVKKFETSSSGCRVSGALTVAGTIFPSNDHAGLNLGNASFRWSTVFAANGSINTSDRNEKNTIIESDLGLDFINKLKPVSYKWNKDDGKTHYGLIAQDIEETITNIGKTVADFGAISKEKDSPMGLNYSQIISPLIKAVQELSAKVAALEAS